MKCTTTEHLNCGAHFFETAYKCEKRNISIFRLEQTKSTRHSSVNRKKDRNYDTIIRKNSIQQIQFNVSLCIILYCQLIQIHKYYFMMFFFCVAVKLKNVIDEWMKERVLFSSIKKSVLLNRWDRYLKRMKTCSINRFITSLKGRSNVSF